MRFRNMEQKVYEAEILDADAHRSWWKPGVLTYVLRRAIRCSHWKVTFHLIHNSYPYNTLRERYWDL